MGYRHYKALNLLTPKMCRSLIDSFENSMTTVRDDADPVHDLGQRAVRLDLDWADEQWAWLYDRCSDWVERANPWGFELDDWNQPLRISRYDTGDKHDWHLDHTKDDKSKLAFNCLLNTGYQGGEFQLLEEPGPLPATVGKGIAFPAYHAHRVTPVTQGTRYVLLGWVTGPRFV